MLDTYQVLSLLILFGGFIIALLTYIEKHNKK
ncbi:MAG: putative holin-like toxin [Acetatifactor sp.]|nr:putative holin-like toxin [Acetatifactor sp.]